MHQYGQLLWKKVFGNPKGAGKVREGGHVHVPRLDNSVGLEEEAREDYVRRNLSQAGVDDAVSDPDILRAMREQMEAAFGSGKLDRHVSSKRGRMRAE